MEKVITKDHTEFKTWMEMCQAVIDAHYEKMGFAPFQKTELKVKGGRRYIKVSAVCLIQRQDPNDHSKNLDEYAVNGESAWAFVDTMTGDVLKPASWKAPAKHARGNLFDTNKGMGWITPHGPAYLA